MKVIIYSRWLFTVSYFDCAQHPISIIPVSFLLASVAKNFLTDWNTPKTKVWLIHLWVMLPTYWFSVWWCFWGAPVASVSISCPSCSATDGVVRNGKSTAGHQRYLCSHCRKTWQLQFTYTASQPGTHQKIIDMAMNGVGCRATARIMGVGLNTILRHLKNSGRSR